MNPMLCRTRDPLAALRRRPEQYAMFHTIEFHVDFMADLEISPRNWLEQMVILQGTHLDAQIKPYVVETADGPVEVADLFFVDGTVTRGVPFAIFSFVE